MNSQNVSTKFDSGIGFIKCLTHLKAGDKGEGRKVSRLQDPEPRAYQTSSDFLSECPWWKEAQRCRCSWDLLLTELFVFHTDKKLLPILINSASAHGSIYLWILKISTAFS